MIGKVIGALTGAINPEQWFVDFVQGGRRTASGEKINEQTALTCAAVYAAVKILSETVASLPLDVFRRLPNGDKLPATDHPVHRLIHTAPNEDTASFNFRETLQGHLGTWGNGYAEIDRAFDGTPLALWQRSPKPYHTKPERRKDVDGKLWYRCRDDAGTETWVKSSNMLHVPGFGFDGMIGYSPISLMREPIGLNRAAERYAAEMYANDARPNGVVSLEGELSEDAYNRTRAAFNESGSEHGSRHRIQLLEGGATFAATQMNPQEVQMIAARRFGVEEIGRAYRISLHLLQEFTEGAASYASIVELGREFIDYTMMPHLRRWEAEIDRKLLDGQFFCEFNTSAFLQGDPKSRAELYSKGFPVGLYTINDMLRLENKNAIGPEGDVRFVAINLQPIEQAIKEPEPPPPPPVFPPKDEEEDEPADEPEEEEGSEDEQEEQRAQLGPVIYALFDRMFDKLCDKLDDKLDEHDREDIAAVGAAAAGVRTAIDEQGLDQNALLSQQLAELANADKELAWRVDEILRRVDERAKFGHLAHMIAERQLRAKEGKAAMREAAKGGNFLEWMESFYENHRTLCVQKFGLAAAMLGVPAGSLAQMHIREAHKLLLAATECKKDELVESVAACVAEWGQRELNTGDTTDDNTNES